MKLEEAYQTVNSPLLQRIHQEAVDALNSVRNLATLSEACSKVQAYCASKEMQRIQDLSKVKTKLDKAYLELAAAYYAEWQRLEHGKPNDRGLIESQENRALKIGYNLAHYEAINKHILTDSHLEETQLFNDAAIQILSSCESLYKTLDKHSVRLTGKSMDHLREQQSGSVRVDTSDIPSKPISDRSQDTLTQYHKDQDKLLTEPAFNRTQTCLCEKCGSHEPSPIKGCKDVKCKRCGGETVLCEWDKGIPYVKRVPVTPQE